MFFAEVDESTTLPEKKGIAYSYIYIYTYKYNIIYIYISARNIGQASFIDNMNQPFLKYVDAC